MGPPRRRICAGGGVGLHAAHIRVALHDRVRLPGGRIQHALTAAASTHIVINIPAFRLYLYRDDQLLKSYPIGIGSALNPTLLGETEIINKSKIRRITPRLVP